MSAGPKVSPETCPECGAEHPFAIGRTSCWLCDHVPSDAEPATDESASRLAATGHPQSFSLMTLMLMITLASVVMGLTAIAPGIGILLIILLTPALVRTFGIVGRHKAQGQQAPVADRIGTLIASLGVVTLVASASVGAFMATCLSLAAVTDGANTAGSLLVASIGACVAAGAAGFFTIRALWRRKER